jgi:filamentous hemagglutinin family protein
MKSALVSAFFLLAFISPVSAQSIQSTDGTISTPQGNRIDISGGQLNGTNLFHSFTQFDLDTNQTANFLSSPNIQNILARVNGGKPSLINGLLQVSGGNSNLFLMNPAGIIFGQSASLNVPASFTATTASGIGFDLTGNPNAFSFPNVEPGAIANFATLTAGKDLSLIGGTILSTGNLLAPNGNILIAAVPGQNLVRLNPIGSPLSFELQTGIPSANGLSIAQLLTGGILNNATDVAIAPNGTVQLTSTNTPIQSGDVALIESAVQSARSLTLLANNSVLMRDSITNPFRAWAGGDLTIQGNQSVDILALNHLEKTPIASAGKLSLISDGVISGDSHFYGGRGFSILNRQGRGGKFISYYDPIISANGDVDLGFYNGVSIKIEATGNIVSNGIIVRAPDINIDCTRNSCSEDARLLSERPAIILRAGVSNLLEILPDVVNLSGALYNDTPVDISQPIIATNGDITVGDVYAEGFSKIILDAKGNIQGNDRIRASEVSIKSGGNINIANNGYVNSDILGTPGRFELNAGGNIFLDAFGARSVAGFESIVNTITANGSVTLRYGLAEGGNVRVVATDINLASSNAAFNMLGGNLELLASNRLIVPTGFNLDSGGGDVTLQGGSQIVFGANFLTKGGDITLQSNSVSTLTNSRILTEGGNIVLKGGTISALGIINSTGTLGANPGLLDIQSQGKLTLGSDPLLAKGNVFIRAKNDQLSLPEILTNEGAIDIADTTGNILTQNLTTNGGTVKIESPAKLSTGTIMTNGGDVTLQAKETMIVSSIQGGDVNIVADLFQATASGISIQSTGNVNITHQGAFLNEPFVVGSATRNGTTGAIAAGNTLLEKGSFLYSHTEGQPPNQINLITGELPSTEEPLPNLPVEQPGETPSPIEPIEQVEAEFSLDFEERLGISSVQSITAESPQAIAADIEKQTGIRPAFIYINYIPRFTKSKGILKLGKQKSDVIELILITGNGQPIRKVLYNVTRQIVEMLTQRYIASVTDFTSDDYKEKSQQLYDILLRPIEADLKANRVNNLVFLMESGLRSLPLASLYDGNQYLVEKYSIGLMPSLSLTDTRYLSIKDAKLLAMGASKFSELAPLPAVPIELSTITKEWQQGESLLNEAFTVENLVAQRQRSAQGIIHLATHSEFKPGTPEDSYIQFWDRKLKLNEIRKLGLNRPPVDLLVLSACRTAFGDEQAELGFAGLAAQSGARSALASLWYVSDEGTLELMSEFYRQLGSQSIKVKAEALRQAQIAMASRTSEGQSVDFSHPYYWAAFTLIGNPW